MIVATRSLRARSKLIVCVLTTLLVVFLTLARPTPSVIESAPPAVQLSAVSTAPAPPMGPYSAPANQTASSESASLHTNTWLISALTVVGPLLRTMEGQLLKATSKATITALSSTVKTVSGTAKSVGSAVGAHVVGLDASAWDWKPPEWDNALELMNLDPADGGHQRKTMFHALVRLLLWHLIQPTLYGLALSYYWHELNLWERALAGFVACREAIYVLLLLWLFLLRPSFLLSDVSETWRGKGEKREPESNKTSCVKKIYSFDSWKDFKSWALDIDDTLRPIAVVLTVLSSPFILLLNDDSKRSSNGPTQVITYICAPEKFIFFALAHTVAPTMELCERATIHIILRAIPPILYMGLLISGDYMFFGGYPAIEFSYEPATRQKELNAAYMAESGARETGPVQAVGV